MSLHLYRQVSDCALPSREKFVLLRLAFTATDGGLAMLPLDRLASDTSLTDEEIGTHLMSLIEKGIIESRSVSVRTPNGESTTDSGYQIIPEHFPKWTPELRKALHEEDTL